MDTKKLFYFDIETACAYKSYADMRQQNKRMADVWDKKVSHRNEPKWIGSDEDVYRQNAPLHPEYNRVVCVSCACHGASGELYYHSIANEDERELIDEAKKLFDNVSNKGLVPCGYNIKNFDCTVLFRKFLQYGHKPSDCINTFGKKPWDINMVDLFEIWRSMSSYMCSLDEVAMTLGISSPKDIMDGSKVHDTFYEGDIESIKKYCENDVRCTVECANKILDLL